MKDEAALPNRAQSPEPNSVLLAQAKFERGHRGPGPPNDVESQEPFLPRRGIGSIPFSRLSRGTARPPFILQLTSYRIHVHEVLLPLAGTAAGLSCILHKSRTISGFIIVFFVCQRLSLSFACHPCVLSERLRQNDGSPYGEL